MTRMWVADHRCTRCGVVGQPDLSLQSNPVFCGERHGFHLRGTMHAMAAIRQPEGTAFAVRDPWPWDVFAGLARDGERQGYSGIFLPEIAGRDAFAALMGLSGETSALYLGTGIVPMGARSPQLTTMGAATLQERSGGRAILGIGTGPPSMGSLERLGRLVLGCKAAFRGEAADVDGRSIALSLIPDPPPPVWVAALGPRAVALAGEVADGVLLNWCPPERVAEVKAQLAEGAARAGRDPTDITVAGYVRACVGDDGPAPLLALQEAAGEYASYPAYARQFEQAGLGRGALAAALAHRRQRPEEVPDTFVRSVALLGDPEAARDRLLTYREAGLDLVVVYPVPAGPDPLASVHRTLEALIPLTMP